MRQNADQSRFLPRKPWQHVIPWASAEGLSNKNPATQLISVKKIDKRTVELFRSYPWPGNIRELQNVVERSVIVSSDGVFSVDAAWLSKDSRRVSWPQQPEPADADEDSGRERQIIEDALAGSRGRVSGPNAAAARLRVPPSTLEHRIKELRIRKSHFKLS